MIWPRVTVSVQDVSPPQRCSEAPFCGPCPMLYTYTTRRSWCETTNNISTWSSPELLGLGLTGSGFGAGWTLWSGLGFGVEVSAGSQLVRPNATMTPRATAMSLDRKSVV